MRNYIDLINEFQAQDVEKMLSTGGGGKPPVPPEDDDDPWDDDGEGGGGGEPRDPTYDNGGLSAPDDFTAAYFEAMLWTEEDSVQSEGWNCYLSSIHASAFQQSIEDCHQFQIENANLLEEAYDHGYGGPSQAGHDFWLTRNRHGAGFWDRPNLPDDLGKRLTNAAHAFGEVYVSADEATGALYVG